MKPSRIHAPMAMDTLADAFYREDANAVHPRIDMGRGSSSFDPFAHVDFTISAQDFRASVPYGPINGSRTLRETISETIARRFGVEQPADTVIVTVGATEGLVLALSAMLEEPGEIIIPRYYYPAYPGMIEVLGGTCRYVDTGPDCGIDVDAIAAAITPRTRGIIINNPFNPFGTVMPDAEIDRVADLGVPVIFDEVYGSLMLDGTARSTSGARHADRHFVVNSFSKSLGIAGFRLGYLIAPPGKIDALISAKAVLSICSSVPSQVLCQHLLARLDMLEAEHRAFLGRNWHILGQGLERAGIDLFCTPQSGFFANIDVSGHDLSPLELSHRLISDHGICTAPADDFYCPPSDTRRPAGRRDPGALVRLNFACPTEHVRLAVDRVADCLSTGRRAGRMVRERAS